MPRTPSARMEIIEEDGVGVLYIEVDGKRIARRRGGELWTIIEPGYTVRGCDPGFESDILEVEYDPTKAKPQ
jgi:hypothetical protein